MSIVKPYKENLKNLSDDLPKIAKDCLMENYAEIVMLVKSEQLGKGLNSDGEPLKWAGGTGFYAPSTQDIYDRETGGFLGGNQMPKNYGDPYNFNWTGETLDNTQMKVDPQKQSFEIFTLRGKQKYLESIYGEIFKLTQEHNDYVNHEILMPYIEKHILDNLFKL